MRSLRAQFGATTFDETAWLGFIEDVTGLKIQQYQRAALRQRVADACKRFGCNDYPELLGLLRRSGDRNAIGFIIAGIAIGETYFFRDPLQFGFLAERFLPRLIERKRVAGDNTLRVWSAGCSSGEELYSIAMLIDTLLPDRADWNLRLLGSDIDREALVRARRAEYRPWSLRGLDPRSVQRRFEERDGMHVVSPRIRSMAEFRHLDLGDDAYPDDMMQGFDLILCRNVLAHLSDETINHVMRRLRYCLADDGVLLLAPADIRHVDHPGLRCEQEPGVHLFRRAEAQSSRPSPESSAMARWMPTEASMPFAPLPHDPFTMTPPPIEAPDPDVVVHLAMDARHFIARREWDGLLAALDAPAVRRQFEPRHGYLRALALVQLGRIDEAAAHCERTLALAPLLPDAQFLWGMLALDRGQRGDAEHAFNRALHLDPAFAEAHWQMALLLLAQRRREPALRHVELALSALDTGDPEQPAHPLFVLSRGELSEAIAALQCDLVSGAPRFRAAS